jgi:glycosyltransferase involved in cell wall biosynthesis
MTKPFLSIIIPTLNEAKYLPLLLGDLSLQSFRNFEVIVVDGSSTDNTISLAQAAAPKLPQLTVVNSPKRNVCYQRNLGAQHAQSHWLVFMDADDRLSPYFLQGLAYRLEKCLPKIFTTYLDPDSHHAKDLAIAKIVNMVTELQRKTVQPTCMESLMGFDAQTFRKLGGFDETVHFAEGVDILIRARKHRLYLTVFKDPSYVFSFRRLRKQGTLNIIRNLAYYQLARLTNTTLSPEKIAKLYPMKGGQFFDRHPSSNQTTLERIITELTKPRSLHGTSL